MCNFENLPLFILSVITLSLSSLLYFFSLEFNIQKKNIVEINNTDAIKLPKTALFLFLLRFLLASGCRYAWQINDNFRARGAGRNLMSEHWWVRWWEKGSRE